MEFIGREPNNTYGVMHYGLKWGDKSQRGGPLDLQEHVGEDFHVFALEKTRNAVRWYVDGYRFLFFTEEDVEAKYDWPFENVFHFILNLAVGGNWPEYPDATTRFPATLEVDYVRVYDLRTSAVRPLPRMDGPELVRMGDRNVRFCVQVATLEGTTDYDTPIEWSVPEDATFTPGNASSNCVRVNFGRQSGYVQADVSFTCGLLTSFQMPVEVQDRYGTDVILVGPSSEDNDVATYESSTGIYTVAEAEQDVPTAVVYQRKLEEVYDHIHFTTDVISEPTLYVDSARKFYMDARSETAAPCTRIFIQLEDSSLATPDNYPTGRHSRYIAFLQKDVDWQRVEFDFYDIPDLSVTNVDRIVIMFDSFMQRSDTYQFRNLVSAAAGCTKNCEPISKNACRVAAKSEEGACTDGFNNDGFGYNGDIPMDCEDSDCWDDPACQEDGGGSTPTTPEPTLETASTPAPATPTNPPTAAPAPEICNDRIDNDGNGQIDCDDEACASSKECGSWWQPECSAHSRCLDEEHVGDCCPGPLGDYKECCSGETLASCSVHPKCAALGLEDDCCPTKDGSFLSCCEPQLCLSNPKCSGLDGACCPNESGVFLDCCNDRPETCKLHPKCDALGLEGECCPSPNGSFLDCCEASACEVHPACAALNLEDNCCPTNDGIFLECCNIDAPVFAGFTGRRADPSSVGKSVDASSLGTDKSTLHSSMLREISEVETSAASAAGIGSLTAGLVLTMSHYIMLLLVW